jgi:nitroreductase
MEFRELIEKRYSVRAYKPDPVDEEKLEQVLQAARLAPTAANRQPCQLIVIRTAGREAELKRIYGRDWFLQAPVVICAAADLGLGTCWIGAFDPDAAREVLGLPDGVEPIAFTPLGYPADQPGAKKRKPLADLVRHERW